MTPCYDRLHTIDATDIYLFLQELLPLNYSIYVEKWVKFMF